MARGAKEWLEKLRLRRQAWLTGRKKTKTPKIGVTSPSEQIDGSIASDSYALGDKPNASSHPEAVSAPASIGSPRSPHVHSRPEDDGTSSLHIEIPDHAGGVDVVHGTPSSGRRRRDEDGSVSPSTAVEPEQAFIDLQSRLVKRSETAESAAIFGGSNLYVEPGSLSAEHSVLSEKTRMTSRNDGGRDYERKFLKARCQCPEGGEHVCGLGIEDGESSVPDLVVPDYNPEEDDDEESDPFLPVVEDALIQARVLSAIGPNNWFIPCTELVRLMKKEVVARILQECDVGPVSEEQRMALAETICPPDDNARSYKHILATLIIIGKHKSIMEFVQNEIDDAKLPLELVLVKNSPHCLAMHDKAGNKTDLVPFTARWSKKQLADFNRSQWETQPVFFSVDSGKIVHYKCRPGEILPFVHDGSGYESGGDSPTMSSRSSPVVDRPGRQDTKLTKASKESKESGASSSRTGDHDMEGSQGKVFIYRIHPSQQSLKRYTLEGPSRPVAVKKLHSTSRAEFNREYKMLVKLTPLPTPHLAKLLATYEIPHGPQNSRIKDFFLMFECADSNLRQFWRRPPPNLESGYVARWVADQCRGLADALGRIHRFEYPAEAAGQQSGSVTAAALGLSGRGPDSGADSDTPAPLTRRLTRHRTLTHGFHGDLKPENILRYCGWKIPPDALPGAYSQQAEDTLSLARQSSTSPRTYTGSHSGSGSASARSQGQAADRLGVLQITDFGLSSFHRTETADDIKARLLGHPYRPPESQLIMKTTQSLDTWTLGCLFLDFLTWLVKGPQGLAAFEEARLRPGVAFTSEVYFYSVTEKDGWTTVSVSDGVLKWANELCRAPNSSQFVCDFAELILKHMLVIEDTEGKYSGGTNGKKPYFPTRRIETRQLAADMMTFIGRDDAYYEKVRKRPDLMKHNDRRHVIRIHQTSQQLKAETGRRNERLEEEMAVKAAEEEAAAAAED